MRTICQRVEFNRKRVKFFAALMSYKVVQQINWQRTQAQHEPYSFERHALLTMKVFSPVFVPVPIKTTKRYASIAFSSEAILQSLQGAC